MKVSSGLSRGGKLGRLAVVMAIVLATSMAAKADYIYTFQRTGTNAYSFSFVEPTLLTASADNLNIGPVTAAIYTLNDSALGVSGSFYCFAFGSGSTDAFATSTGCGLQHSPVSGLTALFRNANKVGTFSVLGGTSFSYPSHGYELTSLTITAAPVPEPGSMVLLTTGVVWLLGRLRAKWARS